MTSHLCSKSLVVASIFLSACAGVESTDTTSDIDDAVSPQGEEREERVAEAEQDLSFGYSTYLGFAGADEYGTAIALDASGNAYVTGTTTAFGGTTNIFVSKWSPTGTMLYFTYYAGTQSQGIAVDTSGNAYVVGVTSAGPTLTKINAAGTSMIYTTALGLNSASAVKVDSAGNAYVIGSANNGIAGVDVAVGKVNPTGSAYVYLTVFGGTGTDRGNGIAVDTAGNAYIVGTTDSSNFPVVSAFQSSRRGPEDAFVAKLNATGSSLIFSTYLGGDTYDAGTGIAIDSASNVYVTGTTAAFNGVESFPVTPGKVQTTPSGGGDAFAVRFSSTGSRVYATYVGGTGAETNPAIAVTSGGLAYVTGSTTSTNFPTTSLAYQRFAPPGTNAFVAQLNVDFSAYSYSTYLGGNSTDNGTAIAVIASSGVAYVTGNTISTDFPTNVYSAGGQVDAFVTKLNNP